MIEVIRYQDHLTLQEVSVPTTNAATTEAHARFLAQKFNLTRLETRGVGDPVPGSRYVRSYCARCGEPIRVLEPARAMCEKCR
jgi:hypothetical protein